MEAHRSGSPPDVVTEHQACDVREVRARDGAEPGSGAAASRSTLSPEPDGLVNAEAFEDESVTVTDDLYGFVYCYKLPLACVDSSGSRIRTDAAVVKVGRARHPLRRLYDEMYELAKHTKGKRVDIPTKKSPAANTVDAWQSLHWVLNAALKNHGGSTPFADLVCIVPVGQTDVQQAEVRHCVSWHVTLRVTVCLSPSGRDCRTNRSGHAPIAEGAPAVPGMRCCELAERTIFHCSDQH